jgi:acyl-coenzyme A thioesterase PaaI-like protein
MSLPTRPGPASPVLTPPPGARIPALSSRAVLSTELVAEYDRCFGCGAGAPNGLRVQRTGIDGEAVLAHFVLTEAHQGAPGLAHGGVLASAMDEALGTAAWLLGGRYVTGRLETDFIAPVPVGSEVHMRAWCTGVDGRKAYVEGEGRIGAPDGPLAVRAAALFVEVAEKHFEQGQER